MQPVLQDLVHGGHDADALFLGQRGHREGADHHLLPHCDGRGRVEGRAQGAGQVEGSGDLRPVGKGDRASLLAQSPGGWGGSGRGRPQGSPRGSVGIPVKMTR